MDPCECVHRPMFNIQQLLIHKTQYKDTLWIKYTTNIKVYFLLVKVKSKVKLAKKF
jgi:hypothetical protein